ncbi:MAG TPA: hypothetical protein VGK00_16905 [Anaerolineales bacterium]|jgi:Tol biopolymer transport system component
MSQKPRFINKIIGLILLGWIIGACSPTKVTPFTMDKITETPELKTAINLPAATKAHPIVSPTTLSAQSESTPDFPNWVDSDSQYGTIVLVDSGEEQKILVFGSNGQFHKISPVANQTYTSWLVEQVSDTCDLITLVKTNNGQKIISIGQNGEIKQEIFSLENNQSGILKTIPMLSQTGRYIAYVVFTGELYYDSAQHQDIELVALDNINHPVRITSHGGAWKEGGAWSLDGTKIAYTDYDEEGVLQAYITQVVGEMTTKKITQFTDSREKAGSISWSPVGDRIALITEDSEQNKDVWILSTQDDPVYKLKLPDGKISIVDSIFWSEDGSRLLLYIGDYSNMDGLYWFDVKNNGLLQTLTSKKAAQINPEADSFAYIFPFTTDLSRIIFYNSRGQWYLYDVAQHTINNVPWLSNRSWGSFVEVSLFPKNTPKCEP